MDLGELQVFLTVAREGSFSRAAERLYRTQPAVSLAIRKLENGLGQPLFVRGARPVRLTDAGNLLRDYADSGRQYDAIVLDPPAFARSRSNLKSALAGYKELNLRALKMLRPGGILITCSCSYHVHAAEFLDMVASAALDSHRILRILENRGQAKDHPSILGIPETSYLKCLIATVS